MKIFKIWEKWKKIIWHCSPLSSMVPHWFWAIFDQFVLSYTIFKKCPFFQICPLRAVFRSSNFELFLFQRLLRHKFWSDLQKLTFFPTSRPSGFQQILWMVAWFIRLGGVAPDKYMVLFFFEPAPSHQFWSDLQKLTFMHTSRPIGFLGMVRMVARFIRLRGVAPDK